jgi:hypothetical protein
VPGGEGILHKEYTTPGGRRQTSVRLSEDWPHGGHIPFVDDYQAPRALRHVLTGQAGEPAALRRTARDFRKAGSRRLSGSD